MGVAICYLYYYIQWDIPRLREPTWSMDHLFNPNQPNGEVMKYLLKGLRDDPITNGSARLSSVSPA